MQKEYTEMIKHFHSMEWVIGEMTLKVNQMKISNPDFDLADAEKKISALMQAQNCIYKQYEDFNKLKIRVSEE